MGGNPPKLEEPPHSCFSGLGLWKNSWDVSILKSCFVLRTTEHWGQRSRSWAPARWAALPRTPLSGPGVAPCPREAPARAPLPARPPPRAGFQARLRGRLSARPAHTASSSASRSHPGSGLTRRRPTRGVPHGYTCKAHGARCPRGSARCPGDAWPCLETLLVAPAWARGGAGI